MAVIDFPDGKTPFLNPAAYTNIQAETKKAKDRASVRETRGPKFSKVLDSTVTREALTKAPESFPPSEEALQGLLDDVHSSGDALRGRPFPDEIIRYKQAVRNFLNYVVENGYTVEEQTSGGNILKRKKYTLVQVVDRKLEQLAAGIMAGQTSQLDLLSRIEEIAGLLVNLLQ
ncbi:hypothetical protein AGMMS50267_04110 [Spirochaetia bacterium]|nr:hypothetical protein AGMMS50267_04110 [Spirochaetia bacterium]